MMLEQIQQFIIIYSIIVMLASYTIFIGTAKVKEIKMWEKIFLFLLVPTLLIIRFLLLQYSSLPAIIIALILNISLLIFWIAMLVKIIKTLKGFERITLIIIMILTGTFGAFLTFFTINKKKKKILSSPLIKKLNEETKRFFTSFKIDKKTYLKTIALDILFYAIIALSFIILIWAVGKMATNFQTLSDSPYTLNPEQIDAQTKEIQKLTSSVIGSTILFIIITIAAFNFIKPRIWCYVTKTKMQIKDYIRFSGITLFIFLLLLISLIISFPLLANQEKFTTGIIATNIIILVLMHFSTILICTFTKKKKIFASIKEAFLKAIRIHKFIIPYFFILIFMLTIGIISIPMQLLGETANIIISSILLFMFIAWIRFYMAEVIKNA